MLAKFIANCVEEGVFLFSVRVSAGRTQRSIAVGMLNTVYYDFLKYCIGFEVHGMKMSDGKID